MKKVLLSITVLVLFLFSTIAVVDAQTVNKAFDVRPGGWLTLNSEFGMIDVKATNRNRVDVVFTKSLKTSGSNTIIGGLTNLEIDRLGREALADFEPTFEQTGSNVVITGKFRRGWEYWLRRSQHISLILLLKAKIEFQVTVPRRYNVDLTTGSSGDISVGNIGGAVIAKTGYGDIQLGSVAGPVNAKTGSNGSITVKGCQSKVEAITGYGDIQLSDVGGAVNAKTGSNGSITVKGCQSKVEAITGYGDIQLSDVGGAVNAKTGSNGSITVKGCQSKVEAITGYGDIQLSDVGGAVNAKTSSSGDISVGNIGGAVIAETGYGDIQLSDVGGAVNAKTGSGGEIVVVLIPTIAIDIDALSGSGRVSSDFPVRGEKSKNSLKGTINGGGPLLKLRSSYGDIRLLRKGR